MDIFLDPESGQPLTGQLYEQLRQAISGGRLLPGDQLAIERILMAVVSTRVALPLAIFDRLTRWLDGYVGSPEEPHLRSLAADVRAQQVEPVPLRAQQALRADSRRTVAPACSISAGRRRHA